MTAPPIPFLSFLSSSCFRNTQSSISLNKICKAGGEIMTAPPSYISSRFIFAYRFRRKDLFSNLENKFEQIDFSRRRGSLFQTNRLLWAIAGNNVDRSG